MLRLVQIKGWRKAVRRYNWLALAVFALMLLSFVAPAMASASISPTTCLTNIPVTFTVEGLTADTQYTVYVDGSLVANKTADSTGALTFSHTFTSDGEHSVIIKDVTGTNQVASFSIVAYDVVNMIFPFIILAITLIVVIKFADQIEAMISRVL